jgi:hypothetical protein
MDYLLGFFYLAAGSAALFYSIEHAEMMIQNAKRRKAHKRSLVHSKVLEEALESARPTVELWWEERGRQEMKHEPGLTELLPEAMRAIVEEQHSNSIKQSALFLGASLVAKAKGVLTPEEYSNIDKKIDQLREELAVHGINVDEFDSLFV